VACLCPTGSDGSGVWSADEFTCQLPGSFSFFDASARVSRRRSAGQTLVPIDLDCATGDGFVISSLLCLPPEI
jgi:hypothetical protein